MVMSDEPPALLKKDKEEEEELFPQSVEMGPWKPTVAAQSPELVWSRHEIAFYGWGTLLLYGITYARCKFLSSSKAEHLHGLREPIFPLPVFRDASDAQWEGFRSSFFLLCAVAGAHLFFTFIVSRITATALSFANQHPLRRQTIADIEICDNPSDPATSSTSRIMRNRQSVPLSSLESSQLFVFSPSPTLTESTWASASCSSPPTDPPFSLPHQDNIGSSAVSSKLSDDGVVAKCNPTAADHDASSFSQMQQQSLVTHLPARVIAHLFFAIFYMLALHGVSALFIVVCSGFNYAVYRLGRFRLASSRFVAQCFKVYTWMYSMFLLIVVRGTMEGVLSFGMFSPYMAFLDRWKGIYTWTLPLNFVVLRMISFNCDAVWAHTSAGQSIKRKNSHVAGVAAADVAKETSKLSTLFYTWKDMRKALHDLTFYLECQEISQELSEYSAFYYFGFLFYPPLYLCGPIISFNAWMTQLKIGRSRFTKSLLSVYTVHCIALLGFMEFFTCTCYPTAILTQHANAWLWDTIRLTDLGICALYGLLHIWLKLLLIWRFFRFWALLDGIETPENMGRCVFNAYSMTQFWKFWHRSFNRWLIRYIYVPLSGSHCSLCRRAVNILIVFVFVSIWHDMRLKLLAWGLLVCAAFFPELLLMSHFRKPQFATFRRTKLFRWLCVLGATLNVFFMVWINSIGFAFGLDGMWQLMKRGASLEGVIFTLSSLIFFFFNENVVLWLNTRETPSSS